MHRSTLQETFEAFIHELERLLIENDTYRRIIRFSNITTSERLEQMKEEALADPGSWAAARRTTIALREALETAGREAEIAEFLYCPTKPTKPN